MRPAKSRPVGLRVGPASSTSMAGKALHGPQRRPQVMRDRVDEGLQLLVGRRQFGRPLGHRLFQQACAAGQLFWACRKAASPACVR